MAPMNQLIQSKESKKDMPDGGKKNSAVGRRGRVRVVVDGKIRNLSFVSLL